MVNQIKHLFIMAILSSRNIHWLLKDGGVILGLAVSFKLIKMEGTKATYCYGLNHER
jgi:hypothetical protein